MQVTFKSTKSVNDHAVNTATSQAYEVFVNGQSWGWVEAPNGKVAGLRGKSWIALARDGRQWGPWSTSRLAAVVAAL